MRQMHIQISVEPAGKERKQFQADPHPSDRDLSNILLEEMGKWSDDTS